MAENQIHITLPDGSVRDFARGASAWDVAESISPGLKKAALAAKVNGTLVDVYEPIEADASIEIVTDRHADALDIYRHSSAHLLAQAMKQLHPDARIGGGPVVHDGVNGFYYDFELKTPLSADDLTAIEKRMQELAKQDIPVRRQDIPKAEALAEFEKSGEPYKAHFCVEKGGDRVSVYRQGDFTDFCLGPHVPSTGRIKHFKLLSVSGAYWLGNEKNTMMQRIYGISFFKKEDLDAHLNRLEEAKKRDHRKLGKELGLFLLDPIAPASPFFLPKGAFVYNRLVQFMRELYKEFGYSEVITPQIFDVELWKRSGHWEHYKENMYLCEAEEREMGIKPMNCPGHAIMFGSQAWSYRDLPVRYADFGRLHRFERSGVTSGLTRVRSFAQDDAHIFCTMDQVASEMDAIFELLDRVYSTFGFKPPTLLLSTRPEKFLGEIEVWDRAEGILEDLLKRRNLAYRINAGDGAFYGPKIDIAIQDAIGRDWQLATLQLDFSLPERFNLEYVDADNTRKRPVVIHRAVMGSLERFMGILIEHLAGAFPLWLAPVQFAILPINDRVRPYAQQVAAILEGAGLRPEVDSSGERVGYMIRRAQLEKVPYMLVVGDKEAEEGTVSLRSRSEGDLGPARVAEVLENWRDMVHNHRLAP